METEIGMKHHRDVERETNFHYRSQEQAVALLTAFLL